MANRNPFHSSQPRLNRRRVQLEAAKGKSKAPSGTSAEQVQEMAAFLSIQLIEKVMAEAMKPEGESKIDLESIERLTNALQMSSQTSASTESSETAEDEIDLDQLELPTTEAVLEEVSELPTSTATESENTDAVETQQSVVDNDIADVSSSTVEVKELTIETEEEINITNEEESVEPVAVSTEEMPPMPQIVRAPLEIVQSGIPPLRPESVPQRKIEDLDVTDTTDSTQTEPEEEKASEHSKEVLLDVASDAVETQDDTAEEVDVEAILEKKKEEESFRRRLLEQRFAYDKQQAASIEAEESIRKENEEKVETESSEPIETASSDEEEEESNDSPSTSVVSEETDTDTEDQEPTKG